jgi:hypothetical protein
MSADCGQLRWNEVILLASQLVRDGWMSFLWHSDPIAIDEPNQFFSRVSIAEVLGHVLSSRTRKAHGLVLDMLGVEGCPDGFGIGFPWRIIVWHDDDDFVAELLREFSVPASASSAGDSDGLAAKPAEVKIGNRICILLPLNNDDGACNADALRVVKHGANALDTWNPAVFSPLALDELLLPVLIVRETEHLLQQDASRIYIVVRRDGVVVRRNGAGFGFTECNFLT